MGGDHQFALDSSAGYWHGIVGLVAEKVRRFQSREEQFHGMPGQFQ
jgi:hypothetical protein